DGQGPTGHHLRRRRVRVGLPNNHAEPELLQRQYLPRHLRCNGSLPVRSPQRAVLSGSVKEDLGRRAQCPPSFFPERPQRSRLTRCMRPEGVVMTKDPNAARSIFTASPLARIGSEPASCHTGPSSSVMV